MLAAVVAVARAASSNPSTVVGPNALTGPALQAMLEDVMAVHNKTGSLLKLDPGRQWILQNIWNSGSCSPPMGYTQGPDRWDPINGNYGKSGDFCPPWADCSSYATWIYWASFGPPCMCSGADFINNEGWQAGYTGTMLQNGGDTACPGNPADLIIYGDAAPGEHVAIYIGQNSDGVGMTIGHGSTGLSGVAWDQMGMPVLSCRTYLPV